MNNRENKTIKAGGLFITAFFLWCCVVGIGVASYWSFVQTWRFVEAGNPGYQAFFIALGIQYLQNVFLIAAVIKKDDTYRVNDNIIIRIRDVMIFGFLFSAFIDAGTNVGQWMSENPQIAATVNIWSITWVLLCIGVVFVEELLGLTFGIAILKTVEYLKEIGFGNTSFVSNNGNGNRNDNKGLSTLTMFRPKGKRGPKPKGGNPFIDRKEREHDTNLRARPEIDNGEIPAELKKLLGM